MRVIVLGAGGPAGVNFTRAVRLAGYDVVGLDSDPYMLQLSEADERILAKQDRRELLYQLQELVRPDDLIHAQPDTLVWWLSHFRNRFRDQYERPTCRLFLPHHYTILICQDKFETGWRWAKAGLRGWPVCPVGCAEELAEAEGSLGFPYWLRARRGAGGKASTLVSHHGIGEAWLRYWRLQHGVEDFLAEEYLPGRNLAWESIWHEGSLVTSVLRERLAYIYPQLAPSGVTGTPTVARIVHDKAANAAAELAVTTIDDTPHGVFSVDLKEDSSGAPVPTEINAGRFFTTSFLYAAAGVNLPAVYVGLAGGSDPPSLPRYDALPPDLYWIRHIDCPARLLPGTWVECN